MDDRRFDAIAKSLAAGTSRRSLLKGILGLGGAAAVGSLGLERESEAARRPTPTPSVRNCPAGQVWNGRTCVCLAGPTCGAECCGVGGTCCDGACCYGVCFGEELCCPSSSEYCPSAGECCPPGRRCCPDYGCLLPGQCCTIDDCATDICATLICNAQHICEYTVNCTLGGAENCCGPGQVCPDHGFCCTPTCASGSCGSDNGCEGVCSCTEDKICDLGSCVCPSGTMQCSDGVCRPCCVYDNQSVECATTQGGDAGCWACFGPDGPGTPARACGPWSGGCPLSGGGSGYCDSEDHFCYPNPA
jgi:hypothetical protein